MQSKLDQAREQDELRQVLSQHAYTYFKDKENVASVIEKLTTLNNNADHPLETNEIEEIVKEKSKRKMVEKGDKENYIAVFPGLIDLVTNDEEELEFLIVDKKTKAIETQKIVEIDKKIYLPPPKSSLPKELIFPYKTNILKYIKERQNSPIIYNVTDDTELTGLTGLTDDQAIISTKAYDSLLYEDLFNYFYEASEPPRPEYYDLFVLWTFHNHSLEKVDFSPILYFLGLPEKGKSRTLKALTYSAYRGLRKISITDAGIVRDSTNLNATLLLDMMDLWKKVDKSGSEDVFLNRPERGATVSRVNRPEKGPFLDTDYFDVFVATTFATNEVINDILETRAIPIIMKNSKRKFPARLTPKLGLPLRERLIAWRATTYYQRLPQKEAIARGRLGDITLPLYELSLVVSPHKTELFKKLVEDIKNSKRKDRSEGENGEVLKAVIAEREMVKNSLIKNTFILNKFNEDKGDREKWTAKRMANRLKTMGFGAATWEDSSAAILWSLDFINNLCDEYGINPIQPSSVSSEAPKAPEVPVTLDTMGHIEDIDNLSLPEQDYAKEADN